MLQRALNLTLLLAALPVMVMAADLSIVGRVLGPDGDPKPKVEVRLEPIPSTYERARLRLEGRPGPAAVQRTRTAADGAFELAAPTVGMWKVVVAAPELLTVEYRLVPLVDAIELPDVELTPAADLEVRLVDRAGDPLPGAVGAYTFGVRNEGWRPQLRLATAAADGIAHLPLGSGEAIQLEVLAAGHPLQLWTVSDERSVRIEVAAGVAGTVRITDRRKRPLVRAVAFQGSALLPFGLTDDEGRLALVLQEKGAPPLLVSTADRQHGSFALELGGSEGELQEVRLDPPLMVQGRVLDLVSRDPVADALVWAVRGEMVATDEHGRFALDISVYGSRSVQAAATGYLPGQSPIDASGEASAIGLAPAAALSGRVIDEEGAPLAGVTIAFELAPQAAQLATAARRLLHRGRQARTTHRGTFRAGSLPPGIGIELRATHDGFAPQTVLVPPLGPFERRSDIEVVLRPGRLAFGSVVDHDEVAIAAAAVTLRASPPTGDLISLARRMSRFQEEASGPIQTTDAEGRFEIADLAAGRYDLEVRAAGFAPTSVPGVEVPEGGGRVDFGTVVLAPGAAIEGRVTGSDGAAIAAAQVTVELGRQGFLGVGRQPEPAAPMQTDARGGFVVVDLAPGRPVTLTVSKAGYGSATVADVRPPIETPLAVVLQPCGRLEGRVVDRRGQPVADARVMVQPDILAMGVVAAARRSRSAWARTGPDGSFRIDQVEPGTLRLTVDAEGFQQHLRGGVDLAPGGVVELEVVLAAGAVVEGTVRTADGEPLAEASVSVNERRDGLLGGRTAGAAGQTDVEGRYRVTGAPIGSATIAVGHGAEQQLSKDIEVQAGTNVVDLVLERRFEASGQVVLPDGSPAGGAVVSTKATGQPMMLQFSGGGPQTTTAADGTFTLSAVPATKVVVSAALEGYTLARSEEIEVSGDVTGLLLRLHRGATLQGHVLGLELDELGSLTLAAFSQLGGVRRGRVDFAGEYELESMAPGQWHVQAQVATSGRVTAFQVEIPEGVETVDKDIEFGAGFTLSGVVLDGGLPLEGANVMAGGSAGGGSSAFAPTGAGGRFRIENLAAGAYRLMVMTGTGIQHMETLELAGDQELQIEISTGTVSGIVREASAGTPLAGSAVALERIDSDQESPWGQLLGAGGQVETDSRGHFLVPRVRQGRWRVVATKSGYAPGEATVAVSVGATPEVEILLTPTEGVSFELATEAGFALSVVQVAIIDLAGRRLAAGMYSVVDGRVRVSTVPQGRWELVLQGGDSAATRFPVTAPGDQGRVVLRTGGTLHIRLPELEAVPMATVWLTGPDGKPYVSAQGVSFGPGEWMMSSGQAMVPGLLPGVWSFTIAHDGGTWSGQATVTPGAVVEVTVP